MAGKKYQGPMASLEFRAYANAAGYARIDQLLEDLRWLSNEYLAYRRDTWRDYGVKDWDKAWGPNPGAVKSQQRNQFLKNRKYFRPQWYELRHRIILDALGRVDKAFNAFFDRVQAGETPGYPRFKGAGRYRTLGADGFAPSWLKHDPKQRWAELAVKGLPRIWFRPKKRLPVGVTPRSFTLTRKGRRLTLRLVVPVTRPVWPATGEAVGIDRGVNKLIALSTGESIPGIGRPAAEGCPAAPSGFRIDLTAGKQRRKRLSRKLQRQRDAAVAEGRAYWVPNGVSKKTGKPKFRLVWKAGVPSRNYIKTRAEFARSGEKEALAVEQLLHRVTTDLVKRFDIICVEDLGLENMTRSAAGTLEQPGKGVAAKRGLNRELLGQRLGAFQRQLAYKAGWAGKQCVAVAAAYTSQECNCCGFIDPRNRKGQQFECRGCRWRDDADANAAKNILRQGVKALAGEKSIVDARLWPALATPVAP